MRIRRMRHKGFRLPDGTVCVDRSTRYGNPFVVVRDDSGERDGWWVYDSRVEGHAGWFLPTLADARRLAVRSFAEDIKTGAIVFSDADWERLDAARFIACWCDPDDGMACHGDVLLDERGRRRWIAARRAVKHGLELSTDDLLLGGPLRHVSLDDDEVVGP